MLNHSPPDPATIVLQDAGCTIVELQEQRQRKGKGRGYREICCHSNRAGARLTSKPSEGERERERERGRGIARMSSLRLYPVRWGDHNNY